MADIITLRDPEVNTIRVRPESQTVNNGRMAFSDTLKALRHSRGMTQEGLAMACGWSGQSRVANYESSSASAREPKLAELPILAAALGVTVAQLVGEAKPEQPSQTPRLDPYIIEVTAKALTIVLARRGNTAFDLTRTAHVLLFAECYELAVTMLKEPGGEVGFGATVAELVTGKTNRGNDAGDREQAGGADGGRRKGGRANG